MKKALLISWGITLIGLIGLLLHPNPPDGYSSSLQGYGDDRGIERMNPYDPPIYRSQKAEDVKMGQYRQQYPFLMFNHIFKKSFNFSITEDAMNTQLTSDQIEFYRENGFLIIDDFLKGTELSLWQDAVDEAIAEHVGRPDTFHNQKGEDGYYKNVFVQCVNLWKTSDQIKQLILDPELGKLATDLAGTSGVRLYHDHAMVKQPWANPTNFHVDNPYDPFYSHQAIMFWVALDDTTIQNGCLYFLPGTHKTSGFEVGGSLGQAGVSELFREYPEWAEIEPYAAEMKAGAGVFISGMVAHAAGPNMTTYPRRAFAMLFMPEDATFNGKKSALPDEVFAKLKTGDVLADDAHLPLVFSYRNGGTLSNQS